VHLKRLELLGFKSFPDKTVIKLIPGVTAIVGPNGCGKTNILDSIRWALGEQKVSLLRGAKMEEIIFNGSRDLKPLGMAEVTLVIQNSKGILPTEYSEVQITRRLFRSGESEYLLNKVPCRLKDIGDLLMDTGVGAHVYSVIQQDMIDAILSDRAEERRFLFEEAAGISKYKNRKKAAIRKLEATEQDLFRLKDIVAEVNTQVNALNRQMKKAERYQKMAEEMKNWELFVNKVDWENLCAEKRELIAEKGALGDALVGHDAAISALSARLEEGRKRAIDLDAQLRELAAEIYQKSEASHAVEKEISILSQKRESARQLKEKNSIEIEALGRRKNILLEQIGDATAELETARGELQSLHEKIVEYEKLQTEADERLLSFRKTREDLSRQLMALEGRLSAGKSDDANLKEQETELGLRLSDLERQLAESESRKIDINEKTARLEESRARLTDNIDLLRKHKSGLEEDTRRLNEKSETLSAEIIEISSAMEAAEARRHLLNEMIVHYEGYGSGVIAAFEKQDNWPGLIGTVADNITPLPGFENAIETALGELAGYVICRDRQTADQIISYLKNEKRGRIGIIIQETVAAAPPSRPQAPTSGFLGWAEDYVSVSDDLRPLATLLLSGIAIAQPENCENLLEVLPPLYSVVSTDGKFYRSRSIISGGSMEGLSLFGRREKAAEQERILADLGSRLASLKESRNEATAQLAAKQAELRKAESEIEDKSEELFEVETQITSFRFQLQNSESDLHRIEKEKKGIADKLETLRSRQYTLTLNFDQLARAKADILQKINERESAIGDCEARADEIQKRLSELQISLIEHRGKIQGLESRIVHTRELISEVENTAVQKRAEISQADIEIQSGIIRGEELERELRTIFDARDILMKRETELRQTHSGLQESLGETEKEIKSCRALREETLSRMHAMDLRLTEIESGLKTIVDKIKGEYNLEPDSLSAVPPDPELLPEKRAERIQELKEAIKNYGAVNLLALEEYKSAKERQDFLSAQLNDLLNAKSTLQSTISKINATARDLFQSTFAEVRNNFKKVFEELFTGGDADIRLIDENDPLESPIEIIARPRGKKLLSIAQMSGGERALTAISLLFAIYLVKPSPFCILDEIDAPLDDANIHRFLKMIKAFSDQTQFIIITHNKITMEAADVLYGVTMERPGVSRVVSVRFNEDGEDGLINSSPDGVSYNAASEIPESIQSRITSNITRDSFSGADNN
jgi:chromosome segregation protein